MSAHSNGLQWYASCKSIGYLCPLDGVKSLGKKKGAPGKQRAETFHKGMLFQAISWECAQQNGGVKGPYNGDERPEIGCLTCPHPGLLSGDFSDGFW